MIMALIPAKEPNGRLPGKNSMLFNGEPLIERTIRLVREIEFFDKILVSTDIESILKKHPDIANIFPGKIYHTGKIPIQGLVDKVWEKYKPDMLFMIQCTTPQRVVGDILTCATMMENGGYNSLITVNRDWKPNGCCQVTKTGRFYDPPLCVLPSRIEMVDIDDIYDFRIAEALCRR